MALRNCLVCAINALINAISGADSMNPHLPVFNGEHNTIIPDPKPIDALFRAFENPDVTMRGYLWGGCDVLQPVA